MDDNRDAVTRPPSASRLLQGRSTSASSFPASAPSLCRSLTGQPITHNGSPTSGLVLPCVISLARCIPLVHFLFGARLVLHVANCWPDGRQNPGFASALIAAYSTWADESGTPKTFIYTVEGEEMPPLLAPHCCTECAERIEGLCCTGMLARSCLGSSSKKPVPRRQAQVPETLLPPRSDRCFVCGTGAMLFFVFCNPGRRQDRPPPFNGAIHSVSFASCVSSVP